MKSLNEQTIKRLQKLAGINEIKVQLPPNYRLPSSLQKFLDEEFNNRERRERTQIMKILIGWIPFDIGSTHKDGYRYHEDNFDNYKSKLNDPNAIKFVEAVKKLPKCMYLGNWNPRLTSKGHSIKIIFNDSKQGNFNVSAIEYSYWDDDDSNDKFFGYFDNSGIFFPED